MIYPRLTLGTQVKNFDGSYQRAPVLATDYGVVYVPKDSHIDVFGAEPNLDGFFRVAHRAIRSLSNAILGSCRAFEGLNELRKRKRVFHRAVSGVRRNRHLGRRMRFLTLSTPVGFDKSDLSRCFNAFCKRLEHVYFDVDDFNAFHIEYIKVTTDEGNGVIHCIYWGSPVKKRARQVSLDNLPNAHKRRGGFPARQFRSDVGYIPFSWLKRIWAEVVGGNPANQHVYIENIYGSHSRVAGYLCQYVTGQDKLRHSSYTSNWVYRGFVGDWNEGFAPRIADLYRVGEPDDEALNVVYREWDNRICNEFLIGG